MDDSGLRLSDDLIESLLGLPKRIVGQSHVKLIERDGHLRRNLDVATVEEEWRFQVFFRQAIDASWDFSIGLVLRSSPLAPLVLLRCNGDHGPHRNPDGTSFDGGCHVHVASEEAIDQGFKVERKAIRTDDYATFEEAKTTFPNRVNIQNWEEYVTTDRQGTFGFEGGDAS